MHWQTRMAQALRNERNETVMAPYSQGDLSGLPFPRVRGTDVRQSVRDHGLEDVLGRQVHAEVVDHLCGILHTIRTGAGTYEGAVYGRCIFGSDTLQIQIQVQLVRALWADIS